MSRIGKQPITLPERVTAQVDARTVTVKGPRGELQVRIHPDIAVKAEGNTMTVSVARKTKQSSALWGTTRANLANAVKGVTEGFRKQLELHGVGFRAAVKGKALELQVGFSHPVTVQAPEGITFAVEKETVTIEGNDIQAVGHVAASIRAICPPEPYKGKGIRYAGETVRRKVGKVVGTTTT